MRGRRERAERRPAGVVIVSFPKSGRTWLRVLVGRALCSAYQLPEELLLDTLELSRRGGCRPTVFSHDGASNTEGRHWRRLVRDKSEYGPKKVLFLRRDPREFSLLNYEELHADTGKALRKTLEFMEARDLSEDVIRDAVEYSRFENMRRMETSRHFDDGRMLPGRGDDEESLKVRKGRVGGYRDYLSAEDVVHCDRVLEELGCPLLDLPT